MRASGWVPRGLRARASVPDKPYKLLQKMFGYVPAGQCLQRVGQFVQIPKIASRPLSSSSSSSITGTSKNNDFPDTVIKYTHDHEYDKAVRVWESNFNRYDSRAAFLTDQSVAAKLAAMVAYAQLHKPFICREIASNLCDSGHYASVPGYLLRAYCQSDSMAFVEAMLLRWLTMRVDPQRDARLPSKSITLLFGA
jgi:hypothetical protein